MKREILSIILLLLTIFGCGTSTEDNENTNETTEVIPSDWKKLDLGEYQTHVPEEWVVEKKQKKSGFVLYAPKSSKQDKFREKVDLTIKRLPSNIKNLESYIDFRKNKLQGLLEEQTDFKTEKHDNGVHNYQTISYSGETSGYLLRIEERVWIAGDNVHILTFTAEEKEFNNYKKNARLVMDGVIK